MSVGKWKLAVSLLSVSTLVYAAACGSGEPSAGPSDAGAGSGAEGGSAGGAGGNAGNTGGDGHAGTSSSGLDAGAAATILGNTCKADADCGVGLICIKATDNLLDGVPSGVGNGMCTAECSAAPANCEPLGGVCVAIGDPGDGAVQKAYCWESCKVGPPPAAPARKCHGRQDTVCTPVTADGQKSVCTPFCSNSAECGARKCDSASGLCVDTPSTGKGLGSGCTFIPDMSNDECAGRVCIPLQAPDGGPTPGICSDPCPIGSQDACGFRVSPIDAGPPMGACLFGSSSDADRGDLGYCVQLCDSVDDCSYKSPAWTCRKDRPQLGHFLCLPGSPE